MSNGWRLSLLDVNLSTALGVLFSLLTVSVTAYPGFVEHDLAFKTKTSEMSSYLTGAISNCKGGFDRRCYRITVVTYRFGKEIVEF